MKLMSTRRGSPGSNRRRSPAPASTPAPLRLDTFLPYRLNVVAHLVSEGLARTYSRRFGIGIPEWRVIATLGEFSAMTAKAIGAHSRMHKTKVSRAVTALEGRGLVTRKPNRQDRREAFVSLSNEGREIYDAIVPLALGYAARLTDGLDRDDLGALDRVLDRFMERSGILRQEPPETDH